MGPAGRLPAHFCDQILAHLASRHKLDDLAVRCVSDQSIGCISKLPKSDFLMLTPETLSVCVQHPLIELSVNLHPQYASKSSEPCTDLQVLIKTLVGSKAATTLRSLTISNYNQFSAYANIDGIDGLKSLVRLQFIGLQSLYFQGIISKSSLR